MASWTAPTELRPRSWWKRIQAYLGAASLIRL
jgi:hypothetical protein